MIFLKAAQKSTVYCSYFPQCVEKLLQKSFTDGCPKNFINFKYMKVRYLIFFLMFHKFLARFCLLTVA